VNDRSRERKKSERGKKHKGRKKLYVFLLDPSVAQQLILIKLGFLSRS
jgi:hypothetical protein